MFDGDGNGDGDGHGDDGDDGDDDDDDDVLKLCQSTVHSIYSLPSRLGFGL